VQAISNRFSERHPRAESPFSLKKIKLTKFCKNIFSNEKYRRTFLQKFFVKKYFQNFCEEKEKLNEK
jgi:hypothetical protein